eukprot:6175840-Pleurochrysis_carterae.AAC.1
MSAMRMKRALHMVNPCGKWRRTSAARASPRPRALKPSLTARYAPLMRTYVDGCDAVITIIAITMYVVRGSIHCGERHRRHRARRNFGCALPPIRAKAVERLWRSKSAAVLQVSYVAD